MCSARYTEPGSDKTEAMKTLMVVQRVRKGGRNGGFLARAVARCLMGKWIAAAQQAQGDIGLVHRSFLPRYPTDAEYNWEYIESKQGKIWRYSEATESITVWSVEQDGWSTGAHLGTFDFAHEHGKNTAVAVLVPCSGPSKDVEDLEVFRFHFAGSALKSWTVGQEVRELNFIRVGTA